MIRHPGANASSHALGAHPTTRSLKVPKHCPATLPSVWDQMGEFQLLNENQKLQNVESYSIPNEIDVGEMDERAITRALEGGLSNNPKFYLLYL